MSNEKNQRQKMLAFVAETKTLIITDQKQNLTVLVLPVNVSFTRYHPHRV